MSNVKYKNAVAAGIVAGSAIGFVTGLLLAPKSGEELRQGITDKAKNVKNTAKDKAGDIKDEAPEKAGEAKDSIADKVS